MIIYTVRYKGKATNTNILFVNVDSHTELTKCKGGLRANICILLVCVLVFAQI
jgi:hypothetical protein